jgi:hypothetical protein
MKKKEEKGMRSAKMPENHWEKSTENLGGCQEKYASEFGNPEDLQRSNDSLASYAKKNKMKY